MAIRSMQERRKNEQLLNRNLRRRRPGSKEILAVYRARSDRPLSNALKNLQVSRSHE